MFNRLLLLEYIGYRPICLMCSVPSRILTSVNLPKIDFIEIFAQKFHYFEDPFYNFFAVNLLFQDTSYSLAFKIFNFFVQVFQICIL